jgi:hypothetical protein
MLALDTELFAHLVETCPHHAIVMLRRFTVDDDASGGESGPQRQAGNPNEGCLKAVRQIERDLDPLFAVALGVEVDHYRCNGHGLFPADSKFLHLPLMPMVQVNSNSRHCEDRPLNALESI